jgi:5-methylcytosine-specific restriction endonuclease McrA
MDALSFLTGSDMSNKKKKIRKHFRDSVFKRDKYICKACGLVSSKEKALDELDAHHITDRTLIINGGYVAENGITVCKPCHELAEIWNKTNQQSFENGMHPDDLYRLIGSSYDKALAKSKKL